jgi:hypothetical protein
MLIVMSPHARRHQSSAKTAPLLIIGMVNNEEMPARDGGRGPIRLGDARACGDLVTRRAAWGIPASCVLTSHR